MSDSEPVDGRAPGGVERLLATQRTGADGVPDDTEVVSVESDVGIILATSEQHETLQRIRSDLLRVHRALLDMERARYEKVKGRIANNSTFLQLVINDPWFDWLRPMAQLVLLIDERTVDRKRPLSASEALALTDRSRELLRADAEGDAFQRLYYQAVQHSPDMAVLARQVATGAAGQ